MTARKKRRTPPPNPQLALPLGGPPVVTVPAAEFTEHEELMRHSSRHVHDRRSAFDKGFHAGHEGLALAVNPFKRTASLDARGKPETGMDGKPKLLPPTASHLAWIAGHEEGVAVREGRLLDFLRERTSARRSV